MGRPTGITILGILYILTGLSWLFIAMMMGAISSSFMNTSYLSGLGAIGGMLAGLVVIVAFIEFIIAGALFSGRNGGRIIVIIFAIFDLMLQAVSLLGGNIFGIVLIIFDLIVLYYMWRPHVIAYFKGGYGDEDSTPPGIKEFYCKYCGFVSESLSGMQAHVRYNHEKKDKDSEKLSDSKNIEILKERLAKGEITKDEYKELKKEFE